MKHEDVVPEFYKEAVELVNAIGYATISIVQSSLRIGYCHSGRIIDNMIEDGIIEPERSDIKLSENCKIFAFKKK